MSQKPAPQDHFPLIESFVYGIKLMLTHARLFALLSFFPFVVTIATMVVLRVFKDSIDLFWLPVVQFPSSFAVGLQCALILRFIVLHEAPMAPSDADRLERKRAVVQSAAVYATVTYFVTGMYAGLLMARDYFTANPEAAAPYAPLFIAGTVGILWAARWFWLHVPVALNWDMRGFYARLGGWTASFRIFGLFALCSLTMNFITGFLRTVVAALAGNTQGGFRAAFDDVVIAAATIMLAVLFTLATAAAIKMLAGVKAKDVAP